MGNSWKTKNKIGISLCLDLVIQEVLAENNGNSWKTKNKIADRVIPSSESARYYFYSSILFNLV
jgi:hypothetical protein